MWVLILFASIPRLQNVLYFFRRFRRPIPRRNQVGIQALPAGRRIRLQLDLGHAPAPAVERRVFDPLPDLPVAAQEAADGEAKDAGLGVEEARTLAARA